MQARRGWKEVSKVMESKDLQPRLFYPTKQSLRIKGQRKCFPDKVKQKFIITKPLLYEMLKGLLLEEENQKYEQQNGNKYVSIKN